VTTRVPCLGQRQPERLMVRRGPQRPALHPEVRVLVAECTGGGHLAMPPPCPQGALLMHLRLHCWVPLLQLLPVPHPREQLQSFCLHSATSEHSTIVLLTGSHSDLSCYFERRVEKGLTALSESQKPQCAHVGRARGGV
jgi:hypothetical protein